MKSGDTRARAATPTPSQPAKERRAPPNARWNALALRAHPGVETAPDALSQPNAVDRVHDVLGTAGEPLPNDVRSGMESRFGGAHDFDGVRVHTDSRAAASADALDASAFTVGRHVVFGEGRFAPSTPEGTHLLAHELTHVVQQRHAPDATSSTTLPHTTPGDPSERAADSTAQSVMRGEAPSPTLLRAAPAGRLTIARQPKPSAPPAPARTHTERHVDVVNGSIHETFDFYDETDELGKPLGRQRLDYTRTVTVKTQGELWAELSITGRLDLPVGLSFSISPDTDPRTLVLQPGRSSFDAFVHFVDQRGTKDRWHGYEFVAHRDLGGYGSDYPVPLWTLAARGPEYVQYDLADQRQVDALIEEVRKRLPPRKPKPKDITEDEFKRMSPAERDDLAWEALKEEFELSNVAKNLLIAGAILLGILAVLALAIFFPEVAIGIVIAAAIAALIYALRDTITNALQRFADSDIGGAILTILKGLAIALGVILGAFAIFAAIVGAPVEFAALLVIAAVVVGIGLLLAYHDYQRAKSAPDLGTFRRDIKRSARGFEGAISDAILTVLGGLFAGKKPPQRTLPSGAPPPRALPSGPTPKALPPGEPVIIEPPTVAPAAPPVPEIPSVAGPAPPVPETPQVAGPTVMVPRVPLTPAIEATGAPLRTTPMRTRYQGEHIPGNPLWAGRTVRYLTPAERLQYRLTFRDGKIYDANGALFDTTSATGPGGRRGKAIYVVDENGNFYASNYAAEGEFHHSSLLGGEPVAAAGEMTVENGVLKLLNDESGHYWPDRPFSDQAVTIMQSQGVDMTQVTPEFRPPAPPRTPRPGRRRGP